MKVPVLALAALCLSACSGAAPDTVENAALAAENRAGLDGDIVELPGGEGDVDEVAADDTAAAPSPAAITRADGWVGRWRGVEGLNLVVARGEAPGRYRLDMAYSLDDRGVFDGVANDAGIAFTRPDGPQTLRAGDGEATGLKWLADKEDCLIVKAGEGYCRD